MELKFYAATPAIRLHVVEPDMVGAARIGFRENQNHRRDPSIGLEATRGQRDDRIELLFFDNHPAQFLVRLGGAEQHPVRHDDRCAALRPAPVAPDLASMTMPSGSMNLWRSAGARARMEAVG